MISCLELIEAYLRQLDITKAEHVVFCADGARSYWKRFGPLARKLKLMGHFEVIDYTHAKQNLLQITEDLPKKMASIINLVVMFASASVPY